MAALLILCLNSLNAQTKFNVNVYGGYSLPAGDLKGDFPDSLNSSGSLDFTKSRTLLTKTGFNFGATGKYVVDTTGHARLTAGFNYSSFKGNKDYSRTSGITTLKNSVGIFTISAGAEYSLSPKDKVNPFAGLDLAVNIFSGKIESSGDTAYIIDRKSEARFGVVATGGVDIKLNKNIGIVIGIKYAFANLIGRKTETSSINDNSITDDEEGGTIALIELPLNDDETSSNRSKTINYIQFYAGLSIYLGDIVGK